MFKILVNNLRFQVRSYCNVSSTQSGSVASKFYDYLMGNQSISRENKPNLFVPSMEAIKLIDDNYKNKLTAVSSDPVGVFEIIDELFESKPHLLTRLQTSSEALTILVKNLETNFTKNDFLKLCFYFSLYKKKAIGQIQIQKLIDHHLNKVMELELNSMDLAIICLSTFKCSIRIERDQFHKMIIKEFLSHGEDDKFFQISLIKYLRLNRVKSEEIFDKLRKLNYSKYDFHSLIHIFPYIADNRIRDDDLNRKIIQRCVETFDDKTRTKDIQKMLHSAALLNLTIDKTLLSKIEDLVVTKTNEYEYFNFFDHYVNTALSLWILNYKCIKLTKILLDDKRFNLSGDKKRLILDSRKKLLRTCIELECPQLLRDQNSSSFDENRISPNYLIKKSLEKVMATKLNGHKNATFVQQILNLNIAGILVRDENGNSIHFEVLDDRTSLLDGSPDGLMQLKMRLLSSQGCKFELVRDE